MRNLIHSLLTALVLVAPAANAYEAGTWVLRAGAAVVDPDASSSELALDGAAIAGSEADVDDNTQISLIALYKFSGHWGIELLASTPFTHDISANTGALGLGEVAAGETSHLPPTLSLQYFFADPGSAFQPYLGAGVNYTLFFDEDVDAELEAVLGPGELSLDDSVGLALQAGFDYTLTDSLSLNVGVWWVDIDTDAEFTFGTSRLTTEVEIDPFVYSVNLGWRFN